MAVGNRQASNNLATSRYPADALVRVARAFLSSWRIPGWRIPVGGGILTVFMLVALLAPLIAPRDPLLIAPALALSPPSWEYLLGNDEFGRDVLSRLIFGARISMSVSIMSIALAFAVGGLVGLVAGYSGGFIDHLIMRSCDVLLAIPPVVLAIGVVAILGSSVPNLVLTIAVLYVPRFARVAYACTKAVQTLDYVQASLVLGARGVHIVWKTILPAICAPLVVQGALALGAAMLMESGLSFIGLGVQPPTPTWGEMVSSARNVMELAPFLVLWPSIVLAVAILSFNILGDGVRDALDPQWRSLRRRRGA